MQKIVITLGIIVSLSMVPLLADPLSKSLNSMLKKKDTTGMVNLSGLRLNGSSPQKAPLKRRVFKSRPDKTVIGHYHDHTPVYKKEADAYIKKVTKGKIKDLDRLPKKQRLLVLGDLQKMYAAKHFKSRSADTVIATVNNKEIYKKEADAFLQKITAGKVKDFDRLDEKQRAVLIKDLVRPMVITQAIKNGISQEEKEEIYKQVWLEKQRANIEVTADEMLTLYETKKAQTLASNPQAKIPPYITLGNRLKNEIIEQKIMAEVMKDVNITINDDSNGSSERVDKIATTKERK